MYTLVSGSHFAPAPSQSAASAKLPSVQIRIWSPTHTFSVQSVQSIASPSTEPQTFPSAHSVGSAKTPSFQPPNLVTSSSTQALSSHSGTQTFSQDHTQKQLPGYSSSLVSLIKRDSFCQTPVSVLTIKESYYISASHVFSAILNNFLTGSSSFVALLGVAVSHSRGLALYAGG